MLVAVLPIFGAATKIMCGYSFVAPLSNKVFPEYEIKVLGKASSFAPIEKKSTRALKQDFAKITEIS